MKKNSVVLEQGLKNLEQIAPHMFVDLQEAYENVPTSKLRELLQQININYTPKKAIHNLYKNLECHQD